MLTDSKNNWLFWWSLACGHVLVGSFILVLLCTRICKLNPVVRDMIPAKIHTHTP